MWYTLYSLVKEQRSIFAAQKSILTQFPKPVKAFVGNDVGNLTLGPAGCQGIFAKPF